MADLADDRSSSDPSVEPQTEVRPVKAERGRSSIEWPYFGLDEAIKVARAVFELGGKCQVEQLAGEMNQTVTSGGFRLKLQATKTFGLTTSEQGSLVLTAAGNEILEQETAQEARANAFLRVPLYSAIYETYKGKSLPSSISGLEAALVNLGVAAKQRDRARQAFQRSAKEAGFFAYGASKLVYPVLSREKSKEERETAPERKTSFPRSSDSSTTETSNDLHPFILGLLRTLPQPGTEWPVDGRRKWLQSALSIFDLIYESSDNTQSLGISVDR